MRKILVIILITCGITGITVGQGYIPMVFNQPSVLTATAGHDTLCCKGHPVYLGGNPTASGGTKSYVYLWSPSDGLNDPTSSNPVAILSESKTYTLSVTDENDCQAVSSVNVEVNICLGIDVQKLNPMLTVFPNPSNGAFTIQGINSFTGNLQKIEVLNQLGQIVYKRNFDPGDYSSDLKIDTQINESGVYFLRVSLSDRIVSQRLIVR